MNCDFLIHSSFANEKEEQEKFKREAQDIYRSVNISSIVPYEAFLKGYVGYQKYRKRLNGAPIITFLNYSIPSNRPRLVTVDFQSRTVPFVSHAAHGRNSASQDGGVCQRTEVLDMGGKSVPACPHINGVPGVGFSNSGNSLQSSLGFIMASEPNMGKVVGKSLILKGLEEGNSQIQSRSILFHDGAYVESGGNSWGCIAIPPAMFDKGYELLKNNTLIYSFEGSKASSGSGESPSEQEDLKEAVAASKDQNYSSTPDVSNVKKEKPAFEELDIAKANPSIGARAMGITPVAGAAKSTPPSEILKGSSKFEECQNLSDRSWEDTVKFINDGGNASECFRGSWSELHQTIIKGSVENVDAMNMAEARLAIINDCVALAHEQHADYKMPNINQPQTKSSKDKSINCVYQGAESQDYQACLATIDAHDALLANEEAAHKQQESDFKSSSENRVNQVSGENAQSIALSQLSGLATDHSNVALERADISSQKIDKLAAVAARIPTKDSLYDECKEKFSKHGTVSIDEYNQFAKVFMAQPKPYGAERDYCQAAITNNVNPIQNQKAREEVKQELKKYGREMDEYTSKSSALLNRTTQTPGLNESSFGMALTDLNMQNSASNLGADKFGGNTDGTSILMSNGGTNTNGGNFNNKPTLELSKNGASQGYNSFSGLSGGHLGYSAPVPSGGPGDASLAANYGSNGIYNEDFYSKINMALQNPSKVNELNLSPSQMKEFLTRLNYKNLMAKGSNDISGRSPASVLGAATIKDQPQEIGSKEQNIFDIISSRYSKKFVNGL